jgi:lysine 2,3-aminomutase
LRRRYPGVSLADWNDWRWQLRNRIRSVRELARFLELSPEELGGGAATLPVAITPYYAGLLEGTTPSDPLRRSVAPTISELERRPEEAGDPLGEEADTVVPGLVHRYPDRVLFLVTEECAVYCRYCTRSRLVGRREATCERKPPGSDRAHWESALGYIAEHCEVRDVLISGGDPLTLPDHQLDYLLRRIRESSHRKCSPLRA